MKNRMSNVKFQTSTRVIGRWTIILLVFAIIAMVAGTLLEKLHGSAFALTHVYRSPWFMALLALILVLGVIVLVRQRLYRRPPTAGIHFAFALIIVGILLTTFTAQSGRVTLSSDSPSSSFQATDNGRSKDGTFPFEVRLRDFRIVYYPGTHAPQDFVSDISFVDADGTVCDAQVSMNHIARHQGYRFYQSGFDDEGNVFLTVAHDPWGIACSYAGYIILLLSFVGFFFDSHSNFRQLLRQPVAKGAMLFCLLLTGSATMANGGDAALPRTLPKAQAERLGGLYVLYNDRVCPLQTLATEFTTKLYGKSSYRGLTAEQVLAGWIFYYSDWSDEPMFKIKGPAVRSALGIEGRYASLNDFVSPRGEYRLQKPIDSLSFSDPLRAKFLAADEKYNLIAMLYGGQLLKLFPLTDSTGDLHWYSQSDPLPLSLPTDEYTFIRKHLSYCQELVVFGRFEQLDTVFSKIRAYQERKASDYLPSVTRFSAERLVNRMNFSRVLAMLFITLGLICFAYTLVRMAQGRDLHRGVRLVSVLLLILLAAYLLVLFILRWYVSTHVPMSNGYETMLFLSLCVAVVALVMQRRQVLALPCGLLLVGFTLLVAMMGGSNPSVTQLMPVLNSPLLCLHVAIIMLAYALLSFAMLNGVGALILDASSRRTADEASLLSPDNPVSRLQRISQIILYPAVFCLAIGIFIGAVWANVSWGTYWSWDPKEVWALITLLVYAAPLHARSLPWLRRPRTFHIYMVVAFLSVLFTYFGVNFLLGGLHSYA
ncbi:MAG: cytochrome c biogenesis protein CcsA [Bacteroidales bacterium]|nr:cytochrome c biogenesis protein CcsA [Bacteroidales bacterium]